MRTGPRIRSGPKGSGEIGKKDDRVTVEVLHNVREYKQRYYSRKPNLRVQLAIPAKLATVSVLCTLSAQRQAG
jgi:hypothetical protein